MFYWKDEFSRPSGLVVLSASVPCRASVGARARDRRLDAVRLRQCAGPWPPRPSVGALPRRRVRLDLVPPPAREGCGGLSWAPGRPPASDQLFADYDVAVRPG